MRVLCLQLAAAVLHSVIQHPESSGGRRQADKILNASETPSALSWSLSNLLSVTRPNDDSFSIQICVAQTSGS